MAINKQSDLQLQALLRSRQEPRTARGDSPDAITGAAGATVVQTITNGDTTHAPSGDAVYDALALKQSTTLADGYMWIGNGSNVAAAVLMSGDVTITNAGVTAIGTGKVTNAMLAGSIAASKLVGSDIATLGTVTTGTWNATAIASGYGGTGFTTYATGDLIYASAANTLSKLAATTDGYVLTLAAGVPTWAAASGGGATARTAGDAGTGAVAYNGTTQSAGQFDGGTTAPAHTTRLNFDGYFYATRFYGDATGLTGTASSLTAGNATTLATSRNIDGQAFNGSADITVIAPGTHAATSKTTPVDADELPLADSAASYALKKLTWANLKATAKTYFDTLYALTGAVTSSGLTVSATSKILARKSSGGGAVEEASLSEILDFIGSAAQGDILYRGASSWARLAAGTAGQAFVTNGASANPSWGAVGSGSGGALTHLGTATVSGSAATSINVSGLSLSSYKAFLFLWNIKNATASGSSNAIMLNSDSTAANYNRTLLRIDSTTLVSRAADAVMGNLTASKSNAGWAIIILDQDTKATVFSLQREDESTSITYRLGCVRYATAGNITDVGLNESVASSLAIGSTISVFGVG